MNYPLLDLLRGAAALWVFSFHHHFSNYVQTHWGLLYQFFKMGHLGVPMFFVISGYCILASARSSLRRGEPAGSFLYRRGVRIMPPFWCSVLVVAAVPFAIEGLSYLKTGRYTPPDSGHLNYQYIEFGPGEWVRMLTLTQVFAPDPEAVNHLQHKFTTLNGVYWSLAIEVQFYLVVAVAVATRSRFYAVLAAVTLAGVMCAFYPPSYAVGVFLPYWPQFAIGGLLFWAVESGWTARRVFGGWARLVSRAVTAAGIIALAGWAAAACEVGKTVPPYTAFAVALGAVLWVNYPSVAEGHRAGLGARWAWAAFGILGAMSYSLYLLHGRVQYLVQTFAQQVVPVDSVACDMAVVVGTCALAYAFYLVCEAPFHRASQRHRITDRATEAVCCTPAAGAAVRQPEAAAAAAAAAR